MVSSTRHERSPISPLSNFDGVCVDISPVCHPCAPRHTSFEAFGHARYLRIVSTELHFCHHQSTLNWPAHVRNWARINCLDHMVFSPCVKTLLALSAPPSPPLVPLVFLHNEQSVISLSAEARRSRREEGGGNFEEREREGGIGFQQISTHAPPRQPRTHLAILNVICENIAHFKVP